MDLNRKARLPDSELGQDDRIEHIGDGYYRLCTALAEPKMPEVRSPLLGSETVVHVASLETMLEILRKTAPQEIKREAVGESTINEPQKCN